MSRALNLDASQEDVMAMCAKHKAEISCIETLTSGGTRLVLKTGDAAATIGRAFGKKVITGAVKRTPLRVIQAPLPAEVPPARQGGGRWS